MTFKEIVKNRTNTELVEQYKTGMAVAVKHKLKELFLRSPQGMALGRCCSKRNKISFDQFLLGLFNSTDVELTKPLADCKSQLRLSLRSGRFRNHLINYLSDEVISASRRNDELKFIQEVFEANATSLVTIQVDLCDGTAEPVVIHPSVKSSNNWWYKLIQNNKTEIMDAIFEVIR